MTQLQIPRTDITSADTVGGPSIAVSSVPRTARHDWQRISLFTGGVLFAIGNMLHPLEHKESSYDSATWEAAHLTIFFSIIFLVLGLPFLHRQLTTRVSPRLATIAVASSVAGLIGIAPGTIIETFVAPMIGHHAMEELESGSMGVVNGLLGVFYLGGTIALGWAAFKAKLRPRWAGPALIGSSVVLLGIMSATGPAAGVVIISSTMIYGLALSALALRAERGATR